MRSPGGRVLKLLAVSKNFGSVIAVDKFSLMVAGGECLALVGPSGCGKTTVLRLIAGLETPDQGVISFDGSDWADVPPQQRNVAMVFQHYGLYPNRTVRGNIEYPLRLRSLPDRDRVEKVNWISRLLGITDLLDRKPRQLSGGEAQRVALARALVRQPTCFLMDEPLSNLDAQLRLHARAEIKRVQRELGVTTIYVTHDQEEAVAVADKIALMNKGRVIQIGTAEELFHDPATSFVAQFLGKPPMNILSARVIGEDSDSSTLSLESADGATRSEALKLTKRFAVGTRLLAGFRPDNVYADQGDTISEAQPAWSMTGQIVLVDGLSPDYIVHCDTPFGHIMFRTRVKPREDSVTVTLRQSEAYFFEAETGGRLRDIECGGKAPSKSVECSP